MSKRYYEYSFKKQIVKIYNILMIISWGTDY